MKECGALAGTLTVCPARTVTVPVTPHDIVAFGAMLAQPRRSGPAWDATCRRLLGTYLADLGSGAPDADSLR